LEEGKTIKELFPLVVKDVYIQDDRERSLCPSFMKSGSISLSLLQNEIALKNLRSLSLDNKGEEIKKEDEPKDEMINVKLESVKIPAYEEESRTRKEDTESTFSKERRNRKFTHEEDEKLKALVKKYGEGAWSRIAEEMKTRNRKQVRERYVNFLKKENVTTEFTPEEDVIILQYIQIHGHKWSTIAEKLTGKTPIMIKNRYYAKLRKITKTSKQKSELVILSPREDSSTEEHVTPSDRHFKQNGIAQRAGSQESWVKLKEQEKCMKLALADLRKKIERAKRDDTNPTN